MSEQIEGHVFDGHVMGLFLRHSLVSFPDMCVCLLLCFHEVYPYIVDEISHFTFRTLPLSSFSFSS